MPIEPRTVKVLLVEDNQMDAEWIQAMVRRSQNPEHVIEFTVAERWSEAEARIEQGQHFDAILLDLNLPNGQGVELLHRARAKADCPIVILTADNFDLDPALEAIRAAAEDYLCKDETRGSGISRSIFFAIERAERKRLEEEARSLKEHADTLLEEANELKDNVERLGLVVPEKSDDGK